MAVFISKLPNSYMFFAFPFVNWRSASLLLFPIPINKEGLMTIRFFSDSYIFLVCAVKLAFRVLRMVNPSYPMWMPFAYQSHHPLFLKSACTILDQVFMPKRQWISLLELYSVSLKFKVLFRTASQFYLPSTNKPFLIGRQPCCLQELIQYDGFLGFQGCIGYEREDGSIANFRFVPIIFGSPEEVLPSIGMASFRGVFRDSRDVLLISSPIGVVGSEQKVGHMLGIPRTTIERSWHFNRKETVQFLVFISLMNGLLSEAIVFVSTH